MIKEIFESIQGEGLNIGEKQIFVRFSGCNLNCKYCDTDYSGSKILLSEQELFDKIKNYSVKTVSLTGGEPLLHYNFIKNFLKKYKIFLNKKIYLETNGTLYQQLAEIIDLIDTVGMDIKIKSAAQCENLFDANENFLNVAGKKAFIKVVFNKYITNEEINAVLELAMKFDVPLVLQPVYPLQDDISYMEIFNKFFDVYENVRLIGQMHKFLNIK